MNDDPTKTVERDIEADGAGTRARLAVVYPPELSRLVEFPLGRCVLGREAAEGVDVVAHPTVSRRHLLVERTSTTVVVSDLGSHNGAWMNARPLGATPTPLVDGDVLRFGDVVAVVEVAEDGIIPQGEPTDAVPGMSLAATRLRARLDSISRDPSPVLLIGESGTGKESVAARVHASSGRTGALVVTNCAALAPTLVESQLFGHEKGAFTGAGAAAPGFFRAADGGTLFLDEVGELPLDVQPKLLRAVELGEVIALGSTTTKTVNTRIVAATNRDLGADVESGSFRRDLYARLSLLETRLPPLRERRADILGWIEILHQRWASKREDLAETALEFTADAVELLLVHPWNENLRGLDRLIHELGAREERVTRTALPGWLGVSKPAPTKRSVPIKGIRRPSKDALVKALEEAEWNIAAVASAYGKDRKQIYRWIEALGIDLPR